MEKNRLGMTRKSASKHEVDVPPPSLVHRLVQTLGSLSLSAQFLIAASLIVFGLMTGVSFFAAAQVEKAALNAAGSAGAVRMQTLVAPLLKLGPTTATSVSTQNSKTRSRG